ncbi:MAG TPA: hypothetical protein VJO52_08650 [Gemmatimonadaceae bacterium]|nr:hypothetical protein [Gemmatimonadaceae bacterium]
MSARRDHTFFTDRDLGNQFPHILASAGLKVERHRDHFAADCPDVEWLSAIGPSNGLPITHNSRIRYTPNELAAVMRFGVGLLVVIGHAPYAELARPFVVTVERIQTFLDARRPPFIAKVYRAAPTHPAGAAVLPGRIEIWHPR